MNRYSEAWVCLFGKHTPREIVIFLAEGKFQYSRNNKKADEQLKAWTLLFGQFTNQKEASLEVQYNWT